MLVKYGLMKHSESVYVKWTDQSQSCLSFESSKIYGRPEPPSIKCNKLAQIWNTPHEIKAFPEMPYEEVMSDGGIKTWLTHIQRIGFVL